MAVEDKDEEVLTEEEWLAWYRGELRKGWQDNILIPRFKFDVSK